MRRLSVPPRSCALMKTSMFSFKVEELEQEIVMECFDAAIVCPPAKLCIVEDLNIFVQSWEARV